MHVLDEAKLTNRVIADVRSEQERVAEEKVEAKRGMLFFSQEVMASLEVTASVQLPHYPGYFRVIQATNRKTPFKRGTRAPEPGFSTPKNSGPGIRSPLGYSAMGNVIHRTVLLDVQLWKANERQ